MKTWLLLSLLLVASSQLSSAARCQFSYDPFFGYTCELVDALVTEENQEFVINTDDHQTGRTDEDVTSFSTYGGGSTLNFFPNSILQQFPNIRYLFLDRSGLQVLNAGDFAGGNNIVVMHIRHTNISRIPAGLFDDTESLRILHIDENEISDIDDGAFEGVPDLLEIELDNNQLERVTNQMFRGLPNLEDLFMYNNRISEIEDGAFAALENLIIFDLSDNSLATIRPEMFGDEIALVNFNLNRNLLTSVPRLPNRAPRIKYIFLIGNLIQEINEGDFTFSYSNITHIELSNNLLTSLRAAPFAILDSLDTIAVNYNRIAAIDHELFDRIPSLYTFYMERNVCADVRFNNIRSINQDAIIERVLDRCYYHFLEPVLTHECNFIIDPYIGYACEVSNVTFLNFRDKFNFVGEHLEGQSNAQVTGLRILNGNFERVPPSVFRAFEGLRFLAIVNSNLQRIDANTFEECGSIVHLDLRANRIQRLLPQSFANCATVDTLILDNNQIAEIAPCNLFLLNIYQTRRLSMRNNVCVDRLMESNEWLVYDIEQSVMRHLNRCFSLYYMFLDSPPPPPPPF